MGKNAVDRVIRGVWPLHAYVGLNIVRLLRTNTSRAESQVSDWNFIFIIKNIRLCNNIRKEN